MEMGMDESEDFPEDQRTVILPIEDSLDLHTFSPNINQKMSSAERS
jgi:hypothetical protein